MAKVGSRIGSRGLEAWLNAWAASYAWALRRELEETASPAGVRARRRSMRDTSTTEQGNSMSNAASIKGKAARGKVSAKEGTFRSTTATKRMRKGKLRLPNPRCESAASASGGGGAGTPVQGGEGAERGRGTGVTSEGASVQSLKKTPRDFFFEDAHTEWGDEFRSESSSRRVVPFCALGQEVMGLPVRFKRRLLVAHVALADAPREAESELRAFCAVFVAALRFEGSVAAKVAIDALVRHARRRSTDASDGEFWGALFEQAEAIQLDLEGDGDVADALAQALRPTVRYLPTGLVGPRAFGRHERAERAAEVEA